VRFHPQEFELKHYALLLRRRLRLIIGTVAGCLLAALLLNIATEPVYRATTRLEVRKEPDRSALTGEAIANYGWNSDNVALYTAAELITNRALLRDVVESLRRSGNLVTEPPRKSAVRSLFGRMLGRLPAGPSSVAHAAEMAQASPQTEEEVNGEIDWLMEIVRVKPINDTRLVQIQVEHWVPRIAQTIADTLAYKFVKYEERKRASSDMSRLAYLKRQLGDLRAQIEDSERVLYSSHELGLSVLDSKLKQLTETTGHMNEAYVRAKTDRLAVEARIKMVRAALKDSLLSWDEVPVQNESVQGLWRELLQTRTELARAREVYRPKHPRLMILESQLQSLQDNLRAELRKAVGALESEYAMLKGREDGLKGSMLQTEDELRTTDDRAGRYTALESELKSKRDIYALLVSKAQELQISGEVQQSLVAVVEPATLEATPVRPRPVLNLIMGLIVGLTTGAGLALLLEFVRRTIKTPKDITDVLQLPILGMIPKSTT
jgi:succinoglycan biosynthesis transport protein ExoP